MEKPWTIGDIRQGANNWSLAGDSKVRELTIGKNHGQSETCDKGQITGH